MGFEKINWILMVMDCCLIYTFYRKGVELMRVVTIVLGFLMMIMGIFFTIDDWPTLSFSGLLIFVGGTSIVIDSLLFSFNNQNNHANIKLKSGYFAYLISVLFSVFIYVLIYYIELVNPRNGLIIFIIGNILVFQLALIYYKLTAKK